MQIIQISCQGHSRPRVIMSHSRALHCFPSGVRQEAKNTTSVFFVKCMIKQLLESAFGISVIMKVSVTADNPSLDLHFSGHHKNSIQKLFIMLSVKCWYQNDMYMLLWRHYEVICNGKALYWGDIGRFLPKNDTISIFWSKYDNWIEKHL